MPNSAWLAQLTESSELASGPGTSGMSWTRLGRDVILAR